MKFIGDSNWCNDSDCRVGNDKRVPDNENVGIGCYRGECNVTQQPWEQKMGEIIKTEETDNMENKLGFELPPEASPKPLNCLLKNGQVSTITCPPVVPHEAACALPDEKHLARHVTHLKKAKLGFPVLKLHRLDARNFRRVKDIAKVGINRECARALRKQLQRFRRNERKRRLRKLGRFDQNLTKLGIKRKVLSEDFVKSESVESECPVSQKSQLESPKKSVKKHTLPTTNSSITGVGKKKSPAKKARLQPPDKHQQQFESWMAASPADPRASPAVNAPIPTALPFQPQTAPVHSPLMAMPWLTPAPSLYNYSPYIPHQATSPLIMPPRDVITSSVISSVGKTPAHPLVTPGGQTRAPVTSVPQSGGAPQPAELSNTSPVSAPEKIQSPALAPQHAQLPVSSPAVISQSEQVAGHPYPLPTYENKVSLPFMKPHPSVATHLGKPLDPNMPPLRRLSSFSVASKPPPLIPLSSVRENIDIQKTNKPNTPHLPSVPLSSHTTHGPSPQETVMSNQVENCTPINLASCNEGSVEVPHLSPSVREIDRAPGQNKSSLIQVGAVCSQKKLLSSDMCYVSSSVSSTFSQASPSPSQGHPSSPVPNALPKVSASSAGMTTSQMVLIPASVAFATLSTQMPPCTSFVNTKPLQVKSNLKVSQPVSSMTSSIPPQFYWIFTPTVATQSRAASSLLPLESSQELSKSLSSPQAAARSPVVTAVPSPRPPESNAMAPAPVSSSSYLASLLKAGVPLVPVSSTAAAILSPALPSSSLPVNLSARAVSTSMSIPGPIMSLSIPAPIMSTPPILAGQKNVYKYESGKKSKSSRPRPKSAKKHAVPTITSTPVASVPPDLSTLPTDPVISGIHNSASRQHQTDLTPGASSASHLPEKDTADEDSFKVNDFVRSLLSDSSTIRVIMDPVSADQKKAAPRPPKLSPKKRGRSQEHLARTSKSSLKKRGISKRKAASQVKLKKNKLSVVPSQVVPPLEFPNDNSSNKDMKTEEENAKDGKDSEENNFDGFITVTSTSVITTTSKWQDQNSKLSFPCRSVSQSEISGADPIVPPAKVDYVPVISLVKQSGLYVPPVAEETENATCGKDAERKSSSSPSLLDNDSYGEKHVNTSQTGCAGLVNKTLPSASKSSKKKRTALGGIKGQVKRIHPSGKTSHNKKNLPEVVESLTKKKEKPVSVLRNINLNTGSVGIRSSIICKAESSHEKSIINNASCAPVTDNALSNICVVSLSTPIELSHSKSTARSSASASNLESSLDKNTAYPWTTSVDVEASHSNMTFSKLSSVSSLGSSHGKSSAKNSSATLTSKPDLSSSTPSLMGNSAASFTSLTPLEYREIVTRARQNEVCVRLERLTHRNIKRELKKHRISMRCGVLLRRQLRNWEIKRYLTLHGKHYSQLIPSISRSSPELAKEHRRLPKIGPLGSKSASVQQMLLTARIGGETECWTPPENKTIPSTSAPIRPQKQKPHTAKPPRLKFMGENKEISSNKSSGQTVQRVSEQTNDWISQGIITCNKQQLVLFQNERLSSGQTKFLTLIGFGLARKASRNSDLDSLEGSRILMDPGMFGLKGKSRPPPSWSLVLDDQGSRIDGSARVRPLSTKSHPTRETGKTLGRRRKAKAKQFGPVCSAAMPAPQMYTTTTLPSGQVYAATFMAPGQIQTGQAQLRIVTHAPSGQEVNASLPSVQGHTQTVIHQGRIYAPTVVPPGHPPPSAGVPPTAVVQAADSSVGARILTVDHAGRVQETLSQGIPAAYSRYPTSVPRPDGWNPTRPSNRGSPPPPLTFMGVGGGNSSMKLPRVMPPPLSFMGSSSETSTRPVLHFSSSQSTPRPPLAGGWARALDLSQQGSASRNFGVINHTRHVVPEKRPPNFQYTAQGHIGMDQRSPGPTYSMQGQVGIDQQQSRIMNVVQGHVNPNQQYNMSHSLQAQRSSGLPQSAQGQFTLNQRPPGVPQEAQVHSTVHQLPTSSSRSVHEQIEMNQQPPSIQQDVQRPPTMNKHPFALNQRPPGVPQEQAHITMLQHPTSSSRIVHGQIEMNQQPQSMPQDVQRPPAVNKQLQSWLQNFHVRVDMNQRPSSVPHSGQGSATSNHRPPSLPHSSQGQVVADQQSPSLPHSIQGSTAPTLQASISSRMGTPDSSQKRSPADLGFSVDDSEHHHHQKPRTPEVMAVVEALILQLIDIGLPTSLESITQTVQQLFQARGTLKAFCCNSEAQKWYQDFRSAHAHHLPRVDGEETWPQPTDNEARQWLVKLKVDMVKFYGVTPSRVFYMQELNFFLDKQTREIKYHRMFPGKVHCSNEKDTVTVLFILSADGQIGPGMIIFPRMVISEKLFSSLRNTEGGKEWVLGSSMNGWLYSDCISEFVSDVFVPWLKKRNTHFPVALFTNEYVSNIPLVRMSESFMAQGIQLITVPKVLSPILSPAEWIVADYFRTSWGKALYVWSSANNFKPLLEENFAPFIISCLTAQATPEKVQNKFSKFGIFPFDPQAMFQCLRSHSYHH